MGTVVLSFGAALGISALLFRVRASASHGRRCAGFPLFAFVFLVALGIDYNIFLMTRVREETPRTGTRKGSLIALAVHRRRDHVGRTCPGGHLPGAGHAAAGVPRRSSDVAVALGVLLDTMIVRSVLVTALNLDLGGKIWWPSKLDSGTDDSAPPGPASEEEKMLV